MTDDYAPFPEGELEALHRDLVKAGHAKHALMIRNAIDAHAALRDRCLIAEMDNAQIKRMTHAAD